MNWREAFLAQAWSDFEMFDVHLNGANVALCHRLHYLQMATEKLAKVLSLAPQCEEPPPFTHHILIAQLDLIPQNKTLRNSLGYQGRTGQLKQMLRKLRPTAQRVEDLAPSRETISQANAEYPWKGPHDSVFAPCHHEFPELTKTELNQFASFIRNLLRAVS